MINLIGELDRAAEFIQTTWISVVRGEDQIPNAPLLHFDTQLQRDKYANSIVQGAAIDVPESGDFSRKIIALNPMGEKTENGYPSWDMKPMLLNGPKARLSKKGNVYNIIPFRHGTGDQSGEHALFKAMPKNIYEAAQALKPTIFIPGTPTRLKTHGMLYGGSLNRKEHSAILGAPQRHVFGHASDMNENHVYQHKSSIFAGLLKIQSTYGKVTQNRYLTFRVVSEKSDYLSWWHPGRPAQPHVQFVVDFCLPVVEKKLKEAAQADFLIFEGVGMKITVT